ncbi:galactokinase [Massilia cavernae]|uniref:Galactokinase n=1 Tax=Massilia cavernae TaxID=2320864 RepID=A0A418XE40_9BURK|nr:galactokinase [Massilia cavernae]RJG10765.1 galactokinase [Massilia cavernae]
MHELQQHVLDTFRAAFGGAPALVARSPGRVNLIGEHTDYNDGFVLPCAIDFDTMVAVSPRDDAEVHVVAADFAGDTDRFSLAGAIGHHPHGGWADYVRGVLAMLREAGMPATGANIALAGNVPRGAGLSSSASLEVALALALRHLHRLEHLDNTALALLAQRAENSFVGCNCGIMDQLISARGVAGHALLIDCRTLAATAVEIPASFVVMIIESRVKRGLVDSEYNLRRQQCETAARVLGVAKLRDASLAMLATAGPELDPLILRRARHIISENARTVRAAEALAAGNMRRMGQLMAASHASMRDDFSITVPAIDQLVALLQVAIGAEGGARMTGGGFGGCVVALMRASQVDAVRAHVLQHYRSPDGQAAIVHVCQAGAGAGLVD